MTLDGVTIEPSLALGGWLAFQPMGSSAMVMEDLVLTEQEINPVMKQLLDEGLEVTAIHNHLLRTSIPVFYSARRRARGSDETGSVTADGAGLQ